MIRLRKPSPAVIRDFLNDQGRLDLTYGAVGGTATGPPAGYVVDHTRIRLGEGEQVYAEAKDALKRWEQFRLGWVELWPPEAPPREGQVVAVLAHILGVWWLNACRVVAVVEEEGPVCRFGLTYGTLPGHAATGEERFLVEWDRADGGVWYDIVAFSHPRHPLARLGYPLTRKWQKRFARDSSAALRRALGSPAR